MNEELQDPIFQSSPGTESSVRLRSVPFRSPYVWAAFFSLVNYCGALAILTTLPLFLINPNGHIVRVLIGCVIFFFVSAIVSILKRRQVLCPLCKGTPLMSTRAHTHSKAFRLFPLDHGNSAVLSVLFTQTFRCMYCGARFDLLKARPERRLHSHVSKADAEEPRSATEEHTHDNLS